MSKKNNRNTGEDLVDVYGYYLPKDVAEMYKLLKSSVTEEVMFWMKSYYQDVTVQTAGDFTERIIAKDDRGHPQMIYELNPQNISQAQVARDKEKLSEYLAKYFH